MAFWPSKGGSRSGSKGPKTPKMTPFWGHFGAWFWSRNWPPFGGQTGRFLSIGPPKGGPECEAFWPPKAAQKGPPTPDGVCRYIHWNFLREQFGHLVSELFWASFWTQNQPKSDPQNQPKSDPPFGPPRGPPLRGPLRPPDQLYGYIWDHKRLR